MEIVENKELNGIELYFGAKPSEEIRIELKENGFRWHKIKKCWYAKINEARQKIAEAIKEGKEIKAEIKEQENEFGVKVGDIFVMSWGYEQTNVDFFRVEKLRGKKQVVIKEVHLKLKEETGISGMSADRVYDVNNFAYVENSCFIKDNSKGEIKTVKNYRKNEIEPTLVFDFANAYKYNGEKLYESWYY